MKRNVLFTATLASAAGLFAMGATAQQQGAAPLSKDRMSIVQLATMLEGQGYQILDIELEHGHYEVDMLNDKGMQIEADIDAVTGEVLRHQLDDRYDD